MKKRYTYIADTVYSLFLYLLMMDVGQIQATRYFFGGAISRAIPRTSDKYLGEVYRIDNYALKKSSVFVRCLYRVRMWFVYLFKIAGTEIYAQDYLAFSQPLICGAKYTLLEDGPGCYTGRMNNHFLRPFKNGLLRRLVVWITWGRIQGGVFGANNQCVNRIVTQQSDADADILKGRRFQIVNVKELWINSSEEKKDFIMRFFGMSSELKAQCQKIETIILTQPFCEDAGISAEELVEIYRPYVEKYLCTGGVLIKNHPRDTVAYNEYFPDAVCINTPVPMQLLLFIGVKFKRVITAFSSGVSEFSKGTEIIILGSSVHPKVEATYKYNILPRSYVL